MQEFRINRYERTIQKFRGGLVQRDEDRRSIRSEKKYDIPTFSRTRRKTRIIDSDLGDPGLPPCSVTTLHFQRFFFREALQGSRYAIADYLSRSCIGGVSRNCISPEDRELSSANRAKFAAWFQSLRFESSR
jgi:hypothetical protein